MVLLDEGKALEHLSEFRSSLTTLNHIVQGNGELQLSDRKEFQTILNEISDDFVCHLGIQDCPTDDLDKSLNRVYEFMATKDPMPGGLRDKIIRFMKDIHESIENLHAIHTHRTPISLKAYCKVFIFIFPIIYAPSVINDLGPETAPFVSYFVVLLTEFILISLYNIQIQLEYPFDAKGLDDINLTSFRMYR